MTSKDWLLFQSLQRQERQLQDIRRHQSWWGDFGANIAGNAAYDGALWVLRRLSRMLR